MLVFDKWTCNTNGRQTLFLADLSSTSGLAMDVASGGPHSSGAPGGSSVAGSAYRTLMIDQGFSVLALGIGLALRRSAAQVVRAQSRL